MAHYAFLDENNIVTQVIVGKDEGEDGIDWEVKYGEFKGQVCKRTSYNTYGGVHYLEGAPSNTQYKAFRKNYAGIGYYYDEQRDAFISPKTNESWVLNETSCLWEPPIPKPDLALVPLPYRLYNRYIWDETTVSWIAVNPFSSWVLHEDGYYVSPVPYPNDGFTYVWDNNNLQWVLFNPG